MQFFNDNLISIIIVGTILVLALIGYIAEKKGFGSNKPVKTKENKDENNQPIENTVAEQPIEFVSEESNIETPIEETISEENEEEQSSDALDLENMSFDETPEDIVEDGNSVEIEPNESEEVVEIPEATEDLKEEDNNELETTEPEELTFEEEPQSEEVNTEPEEITFEEEPQSGESNTETEEMTFEEEPKEEKTTASNEINTVEDLYAPFGDQSFKKEDSLDIDKDFNKIINDVDNSVKTDNSSTDSSDEDDIWKF